MRSLALVTLLVLSLFLVGCPPPESYVRSTELALENSGNLDSNVDTLAKNYFQFISKDTSRLVAEGKMTEEARKEVLQNVEEQMANLKQQSLINRKFCLLAHDFVHDKKLTIEEVVAGIQTVNKATPEILEFIEKLKGGN